VRLARALQAARDRRMAMADRVRKMHIQIADNMYDYELQEAMAAYEVRGTKECTLRIYAMYMLVYLNVQRQN
jgi:hypothetical protein